MDTDASSLWDLLDDDLILQIIAPLRMAKDKASLDALMQTSRSLRVLAASSIPSATLAVDHPQCMGRFPSHATVRAMRIRMEPREAITFLQTAEHAHRLRGVQRMVLPLVDPDFKLTQDSPQPKWWASAEQLVGIVGVVGAACPALTSGGLAVLRSAGYSSLR